MRKFAQRKLLAYYQLTRLGEIFESFPIVIVLAIIAARITLNWEVVTATIANLCIWLTAFSINDINDAEDDALDPDKVNRNPISAKRLTKAEGYFLLNILIVITLVIILLTNKKVLVFGIFTLVVCLLYSMKPIRLKARPIIDTISHAFFLAAAQVIFFGFLPGATFDYLTISMATALFIFSIGGDLYNEVRDWEVDRKVGLNNTASILGYKMAALMANLFRIIGVIIVIISVALIFFRAH